MTEVRWRFDRKRGYQREVAVGKCLPVKWNLLRRGVVGIDSGGGPSPKSDRERKRENWGQKERLEDI